MRVTGLRWGRVDGPLTDTLYMVNYIGERLKRRKSFGDYKEELITGIKINISANNSINIPFISFSLFATLRGCGARVWLFI